MRATLGGLYCRRNLGIRGREQPHDLFGQRLVGGQTGELALPQIEVTPRQPVEIAFAARLGIVGIGHHRTITHGRAEPLFADANLALSHCGIGAKVMTSM
jgi:hypothetical protein